MSLGAHPSQPTLGGFYEDGEDGEDEEDGEDGEDDEEGPNGHLIEPTSVLDVWFAEISGRF